MMQVPGCNIQDFEITRLQLYYKILKLQKLKNQPVPWHGGTGWMGALANCIF